MNSFRFPPFGIRSRQIILLLVALPLVVLQACSTTVGGSGKQTGSNLAVQADKFSWFKSDAKYIELANGPLSGEIGASLSKPALKQAIIAEYNALENRRSGETIIWEYSGKQSGKIISYPPYQVGSSSCRRYIHSVSVDGSTSQAAGTACRDKDGNWTPLT